MLTYDQIITLSDKGFSPDQIVKLTGEELPEKQGPEKQEPEKQEPEKQEPEKQEPEKQEPEKKEESPLSVLQESIKGFSAEVAEMRKALQASNIRTVTNEITPPEKSADEILAEMIHPTINKEVK